MELNLEGLDKFIEDRLKERKIPGLGIGIIKGNNILYNRGFGYADIENRKPVTPDTVFRIGSISKLFTAIGLMQLWEQGKFNLDDDINNFLPNGKIYCGKKQAPPITFKHLMTHTSGIGEILKLSDIFRVKRFVNTNIEKIIPLDQLFGRKIKLKVPAGKKWTYANFGVNLLGYILELISGTEFSKYMRENILDPLNMNSTDFAWSERVKLPQAKGYKLEKGVNIESGTATQCHMPAGSIYASFNDMLKFIQCLLNCCKTQEGTTILKEETLNLMWKPHFQLNPQLPAMGLVFWVYDILGHFILNHGGSISGYMAEFYVLPKEGIGMIVCINQMSLKNMGAIRIAHEILHKILKMDDFKDRFEKLSKPIEPEFAGKVIGRYGPTKGLLTNVRHYMGGGETSIVNEGNDLLLKTMWSGRKKGVKLWQDPQDPFLFKIIDKLNYSTVEPYEDLIFKTNEKGKVVSFCKGYHELVKKPWYRSFKFKLYSRLIFIAVGVIAAIFLLFYLL